MRLFQRRYPGTKVSVYKIRKLYQKHKIRKKVIKIGKAPRQASLIEIAIQAAELGTDIQLAVDRRLKIIQLDEFVVTKKTMPTHVWTQQKTNAQIDQTKV